MVEDLMRESLDERQFIKNLFGHKSNFEMEGSCC